MEEDGELDFLNKEMFSSSFIGDFPSCCSMDSLFNGVPNDAHACTHTHTCNRPGPDSSHTHTCVHVHTTTVPSTSEDQAKPRDKKSKNREAVCKYHNKKKAEAVSLVDEVARLRAENQHLKLKLQAQPALKAEIARLKCLLGDIGTRIYGEIGSFPYQNQANSNFPGLINPFNMHPGEEGKIGEGVALDAQGVVGCEFGNMQCFRNMSSSSGCGFGNTASALNSSGRNKRKGGSLVLKEGV